MLFRVYFYIKYWIVYKPCMILWSIKCEYYPFNKYKIGNTIKLKGNVYLITGITKDSGGRVYITKPVGKNYPKEYRPYCYYVDRASDAIKVG